MISLPIKPILSVLGRLLKGKVTLAGVAAGAVAAASTAVSASAPSWISDPNTAITIKAIADLVAQLASLVAAILTPLGLARKAGYVAGHEDGIEHVHTTQRQAFVARESWDQ